jgi:hypothetical protein
LTWWVWIFVEVSGTISGRVLLYPNKTRPVVIHSLEWFEPPERNTLHTLCVVLLRVKMNLDPIGTEGACPFVSHVPSFLLCIMCCQSVWHRIKMLIWIPRQAKKKTMSIGDIFYFNPKLSKF